MAVEAGAVCCACGRVIEGRRMGYVFDGHTFKATQIHGHPFCAEDGCNREAWKEFSRKRTAKCNCGRNAAKR